MRHIIPISGKDSLATAIVQTTRKPDLNYEFIFNPTGQELPEVFDWMAQVSEYLGKEIKFVGEDLKAIIEGYNWFLPSQRSRYCTRQSKIEPMEKYIGKDECIVYYGIRADENRGGYSNISTPNIHPVYPLKELGIGIDHVYRINHKANLKPPVFFWKSVFDSVCFMVGDSDHEAGERYIRQTFREWQIDALFSWRSRTNCAMCFNQRKYEWVGLLEHCPELFWQYEGWEHNVSEYFFCGKDYPLQKIADNAGDIKRRRILAVSKLIQQTRQLIFDFAGTDDESDFVDILSVVSCGLFCGK